MKLCWGNTCGNIFNTGGDIESSARLTLMQGGLPKSVFVFALRRCKWCNQLLPSRGFPCRQQTKPLWKWGCVARPLHITLAMPEWGMRSDRDVLSFLSLPSWHPGLSLNLHLCAPIIYLRCLSQQMKLKSGYVSNRILIKFAEKGRGNGFHWVL